MQEDPYYISGNRKKNSERRGKVLLSTIEFVGFETGIKAYKPI